MDPKTGAIIDADEKTIQEYEAALQRKLVRIPENDVETVRAMPTDDRKAYAKKIQRRRDRRRARKLAKRKQRTRK